MRSMEGIFGEKYGVGQKVTRETVNSFLQYLHDAY